MVKSIKSTETDEPKFHVEALEARSSSTQYVCVHDATHRCLVPLSECYGATPTVIQTLVKQGLPILRKDIAPLNKQIEALTHYKKRTIIEGPGWQPEGYALASGEVFGLRVKAPYDIAFKVDPRRGARAGTGENWFEAMKLCKGQNLLCFLIMATLTGPLLALAGRTSNFGFEIVSPGGGGKTTVQQILASVSGSPAPGSPELLSMHTTVVGLGQLMPMFHDGFINLDEANLCTPNAPLQRRLTDLIYIAFMLADGRPKVKHEQLDFEKSRFVFLLSTNDAISSLIKQFGSSGGAEASLDRMMVLPIAKSRKYKIFDFVPDQFKSSSAFAKHLTELTQANYGHGFRKFVRHLAEARAADEKTLKAEIQGWIERFGVEVKLDPDDGSAVRVVEAFGLVYAAGKLAKQFGVLPDSWKPLEAAVICYTLNRQFVAAMPTPFDMLRQYVSKKKKFIDVTVPQDMDDATYKGARGFIRKLKNGYVEILIDEDRFDEEFGKVAKLMLNDPKIREYMVHDARRHKVKRPVRTSKSRDRVICFRGKRYEFDGAF